MRIKSKHLDVDTKSFVIPLGLKVSCPIISPPSIPISTQTLLPYPTCLANAYLSFKIQTRHHLAKKTGLLFLCLHSTFLSTYQTGQRLCCSITLRPQGQEQCLTCLCIPDNHTQCLAHKEALWLLRMKDDFNLLSFCFILMYTHWSSNNKKVMIDSIFLC